MAANNTQITLTASNQTAAAFTQVNNALGGLKTSAAGVLSSFGGLGSAITVGGFVAFAKSTIDSADAMNDLAIATGTSVASLASYKLAAEQSGSNVEGLAKGLGKLSVFMGKNADEATRLGITARDPVAAFAQLADTLSSVQDPAERNALAAKVLGKSYAELMPLLAQGGDSLRAQAAAAGPYAESMAKMAKSADEFNDALAGIQQSASVSLLPLVKLLGETATAATQAAEGLTGMDAALAGMGQLGTVGQTIAVVWANVAYVFEQTGNEIGGIAAQLAALGSGDMAGAAAIGKMMKADAEKARGELDKLEKRIMQFQAAGSKPAAGKKGGAAFDTSEILGGADAAEKLQSSMAKAFSTKPLDDFIAGFSSRAAKIKQEYAKLAVDIGGKKDGPATGLDVSSDIGAAKGALASGDALKADALVERAKSGLKDLASFEQSYYARQLQDVELSMNTAATKAAEASRDSIKAMMNKQAEALANMDPVHIPIAVEAIAQDWIKVMDIVRQNLIDKPFEAQLQVSNVDDIARAAAKRGAR